MALRAKPRKGAGAPPPDLDDAKVARFVSAAESGASETAEAKPPPPESYPWRAAGLRGDVLNTPFPLRIDGRTKAMLSWLAEKGTIRSQNAFLAGLVRDAVAEKCIAELEAGGLSEAEARAAVAAGEGG